MNREKGFTVIEILLAVVVMVVMAVFFVIQRTDLEKANRDKERKIAVNSMYYALQNVYHKEHGYYPRVITRETLPSVDPTLFTDPSGNTLNGDKCVSSDNKENSENKCEYHYSAVDCDNDGKCSEFSLTADLELESIYRKSSKK